MVLGLVAGLKNGELMMAGVVGGDRRDKMADRLSIKYGPITQKPSACATVRTSRRN